MTTPPLDLPALRRDIVSAARCEPGDEVHPWEEVDPDHLIELLDRVEAAETTIQRVRDLVADSAFNAQDIYGDLPATEYDDQDHAESLLAVTVRALNYAMDGGA